MRKLSLLMFKHLTSYAEGVCIAVAWDFIIIFCSTDAMYAIYPSPVR